MRAMYQFTKDTVPKDKCPNQDKLRILTYCKSTNLSSSDKSKFYTRANLTAVVIIADILISLVFFIFMWKI
jgi:hypothetical protein